MAGLLAITILEFLLLPSLHILADQLSPPQTYPSPTPTLPLHPQPHPADPPTETTIHLSIPRYVAHRMNLRFDRSITQAEYAAGLIPGGLPPVIAGLVAPEMPTCLYVIWALSIYAVANNWAVVGLEMVDAAVEQHDLWEAAVGEGEQMQGLLQGGGEGDFLGGLWGAVGMGG